MRKYTLANARYRGVVDLRDYTEVITNAVLEFAPTATVVVNKDHYTVSESLTQSQAVRIGRRICESDLSRHCVKMSKLFNSVVVKERANDDRNKQTGGHY